MTRKQLAIPMMVVSITLIAIARELYKSHRSAATGSMKTKAALTIEAPSSKAPATTEPADEYVGSDGGADNIDNCENIQANLAITYPERVFGSMDCQRIGGAWARIEQTGITHYALVPTITEGVEGDGTLLHYFCQAICMLGLEAEPSQNILVGRGRVLFLNTTIVISGKAFTFRGAWQEGYNDQRVDLLAARQMVVGSSGVGFRSPGFGVCDIILADKVTISGEFEGGVPFSVEFDPRGISVSELKPKLNCKLGAPA